MYKDIHETVLNNVMPKSGEYPVALERMEKILVKEEPHLVPIYFNHFILTGAENKLRAMGIEDYKLREAIAMQDTIPFINDCRGNLEKLVYNMNKYGYDGYPDLMILTDDLNSKNPAIIYSQDPDYTFEINPKKFELGLTGRVLEDLEGRRYEELLSINLDIQDAYKFAKELRPENIVGMTRDGEKIQLYENGEITGDKMEFASSKGRIYILTEEKRRSFGNDAEVLHTDGLKIVPCNLCETIGNYSKNVFLVGHRGDNLDQFLSQAFSTNYLLWKICSNELRDPEKLVFPLEEADYEGKGFFVENRNRLGFMPDRAYIDFHYHSGGAVIEFDNATGIRILMQLRDLVRDIWCPPVKYRKDGIWDIVYDKSRGITPRDPVALKKREDYKCYSVLKDDDYIMPEFEILQRWLE